MKQILPNYCDRYTENDIWKAHETEHYVFRFFPDSLAEKEIAFIAETQEKAYAKIVSALELREEDTKIRYYLYPSEKDKEELMGDDGYGQAIWHDRSVHAIYNETDRVIGEHEDTHLLALEWGESPIGMLSEGLAEYMGGCMWKGADSTPLARKAMKGNIFGSFDRLYTHQFWMNTPDEDADLYYALAGTFTRYLIEEKGMKTYRTLYQSLRREHSVSRNVEILENLYGSIADISAGYARSLEEHSKLSPP